jgi:type I restriction enzyme S subunit
MDVLPNLSFSVPPQIEEQKVISVILKNILRRIDLLISKQFRLIEMLKEKRQAIITKAVTKGLDPNVQMKDSGVEWIGEIPEHWKIKPLYSLMRENKTKNTEDENLEVLSLSYGNIIIRNVGNNFGLLPESFATYQVVDKENIILRLTDLQNDKKSLRVGLVKQKGIITSAYVCLQMSAVLIPEFAYFMLHSYDISKVFYGFGGGVRQTMTFKDLKHLPLLYPEIDEQIQIIKHIKTEIDKLDILILKQEEFIELLREYRTSLISHAVTGKIDIRGFATDSNSA